MYVLWNMNNHMMQNIAHTSCVQYCIATNTGASQPGVCVHALDFQLGDASQTLVGAYVCDMAPCQHRWCYSAW